MPIYILEHYAFLSLLLIIITLYRKKNSLHPLESIKAEV